MSKFISFAGLVATFGVAYVCDRWVESLRAEMSQTFNITSFLWQSSVANLLLAIALLLLAWYVLFWTKRIKLVLSVFILIGLLITFATTVQTLLASTLPPLGIMEFLTPNSHVLHGAAFVATLGLAGFLLPFERSAKRV